MGERVTRRTYTPEKIINKLRKVEILLSQGSTICKAARKIGVTDMTYLFSLRPLI